MCSGCEPGATVLARILTSNLDFSNATQLDVVQSENDPDDGGSTIFYNGSIITMAGGTFSPVEALAIKGASITAAGRLQDVRSLAGDTATMVDLNGQCILPGFVEPHLHLFLSALTIDYLIPLQPWKITKRSDVLAILKEHVDKVVNNPDKPDPKWVVAYGYDPSLVEDHDTLNACILDEVSKSVGIFVLNQSGHIAYVNHRAFEIAGVDDDNQTPGLVKCDGRLTGELLETRAIQLVATHIPKPDEPTFKRHSAEKLVEWSAKGCTTVFDAGIGTVNVFGDVPLLAAVTTDQAHPLPLRFVAAVMEPLTAFPFPDLTTLGDRTPPVCIGNAKVQAIKFWADGSTQGFTAALNEPYYHSHECGKLNLDTNVLQAQMNKWMKKGWQISIHSNGDHAVDQSLECYEAVFNQLPDRKKDIMHRIEHFTVCNPAQVEKAASLGLGVSHTIGHVYYWGETFQNWVLGPERAARIDPVKDDVASELVYSFHSDSPLTEPDPLLFVRTAVTRLKYDSNEVLGGEQCVTLEEALKGVTVNPARQLNLEHRIGTLEEGKSADLVILAQDPRTVDPVNLHNIEIRQTWYKGKKVYDNA
ncbi:hypothetical protein FRC01_003739 [Tulasnella sp. 417]|nr:hypothetical protein FRC01_003739 [Tulasnella sp. 417]